jgi:hypothetical protein
MEDAERFSAACGLTCTTSVFKYMTPLIFFVRSTIHLFYKYFCKSIGQHVENLKYI